jgi:hypothetical protein
MAERAGFEPARRLCRLRDFQSRSFDRSDTSPRARRYLPPDTLARSELALAEASLAERARKIHRKELTFDSDRTIFLGSNPGT